MPGISPRLQEIVDALPLRPGMRVLEIGGAPGVAAKVVAHRIAPGHILMIDRSPKGIALTERTTVAERANGLLSVRCVAIEDFVLLPGEAPFDLAFAVRVGALDGRHPESEDASLRRIADALVPGGRLFIDAEGDSPIREVLLPS